jgi:DNA polymerase (family 10)
MKHSLPYADAAMLAAEILAELGDACERIEVAGSLRRQKAEIGDIEIVAIPRLVTETDLFGVPVAQKSRLDACLAALGVRLTKGGDRFKQFAWHGTTVDLFLTDRERWGVIYTIRTGSADFSHWLVTPRAAGGALPPGMRFQDGRLWRGAESVSTPEESDVFAAIGWPWLPPAERRAGLWRR